MKTIVTFDDFVSFALWWQWTQRPAGDGMKDMKKLLNHWFKSCSQLLLCSLKSIKGWKLNRFLIYHSTWKSCSTGTVEIKIKYSRTIFFRKGKRLGSACSDHPAPLQKWGLLQVESQRNKNISALLFCEKGGRSAETELWVFCGFHTWRFLKNIWTTVCNFMAIIYLLKSTVFLKHCL